MESLGEIWKRRVRDRVCANARIDRGEGVGRRTRNFENRWDDDFESQITWLFTHERRETITDLTTSRIVRENARRRDCQSAQAEARRGRVLVVLECRGDRQRRSRVQSFTII